MPTKLPNQVSNRLALCAQPTESGSTVGAWWPSSADLRTELPDLLSILSRVIGSVRRVLYDPRMWLAAPSRIIRNSAAVSVDPYAMVTQDTVYLVGTHGRDAVLFVVPPVSTGATAQRILRAVEAAAQPTSVVELRDVMTTARRTDRTQAR